MCFSMNFRISAKKFILNFKTNNSLNPFLYANISLRFYKGIIDCFIASSGLDRNNKKPKKPKPKKQQKQFMPLQNVFNFRGEYFNCPAPAHYTFIFMFPSFW